jgi:hypothetical protein
VFASLCYLTLTWLLLTEFAWQESLTARLEKDCKQYILLGCIAGAGLATAGMQPVDYQQVAAQGVLAVQEQLHFQYPHLAGTSKMQQKPQSSNDLSHCQQKEVANCQNLQHRMRQQQQQVVHQQFEPRVASSRWWEGLHAEQIGSSASPRRTSVIPQPQGSTEQGEQPGQLDERHEAGQVPKQQQSTATQLWARSLRHTSDSQHSLQMTPALQQQQNHLSHKVLQHPRQYRQPSTSR